MSFNDSFAGYLLFEIMMRVLNNKNRKNEKRCWHKRNGMILYLSCLWETVRNILFQRDLKKMFQKRIRKVLDKQERTWYDVKVAAVLMKNGSTK